MKFPWLFFAPLYLLFCLLFTCCKTFDITPYKCSFCNGNGRIVCKKCNGTGTISCTACSGMGYKVWCHACLQGIETYKDGGETKKRTCTKCKGKFSHKCPLCNYGRMKCYMCNDYNRNRFCDKCNGKGIDPHKIADYERARAAYYQNKKK